VTRIFGRRVGHDVAGKIFISYSKQAPQPTRDVATYLESAGYSVWWDANLTAGEIFRDVIDRELDAADAVIVIWTEHSVASNWVLAEADHANRAKKLITLRTKDIDTWRIPKPYNTYHTAVVDDFEAIIAAVTRIVSPAAAAREAKTSAHSNTEDATGELAGRSAEGRAKSSSTAGDCYERGLRFLQNEDLDAALDALNQAIEIDPSFAWAYYGRGLTHYLLKEHELAIRDFDRAMDLGYREAVVFRQRANAFSRKGDVTHALADYKQAIALEPENALAYQNRAALYENTLQPLKAIADYQAILNLVAAPEDHDTARARLLALGAQPMPSKSTRSNSPSKKRK
jgi:tetratricopeptide (TPR) repeat protein